MKEIEAIRKSDLMKLMEVVKHATGLYNALEGHGDMAEPFNSLGAALRDLGLEEVNTNGRPGKD